MSDFKLVSLKLIQREYDENSGRLLAIHRYKRGDILEIEDEVEIERLTAAGAIVPADETEDFAEAPESEDSTPPAAEPLARPDGRSSEDKWKAYAFDQASKQGTIEVPEETLDEIESANKAWLIENFG